MAAISKHYGDVNEWIHSVIESCNTMEQIQTTYKLIDNFDSFCLNYINRDTFYKMKRDLVTAADIKWESILLNNINLD